MRFRAPHRVRRGLTCGLITVDPGAASRSLPVVVTAMAYGHRRRRDCHGRRGRPGSRDPRPNPHKPVSRRPNDRSTRRLRATSGRAPSARRALRTRPARTRWLPASGAAGRVAGSDARRRPPPRSLAPPSPTATRHWQVRRVSSQHRRPTAGRNSPRRCARVAPSRLRRSGRSYASRRSENTRPAPVTTSAPGAIGVPSGNGDTKSRRTKTPRRNRGRSGATSAVPVADDAAAPTVGQAGRPRARRRAAGRRRRGRRCRAGGRAARS